MASILIVEDDKPINELIARNLKLVGHIVNKYTTDSKLLFLRIPKCLI